MREEMRRRAEEGEEDVGATERGGCMQRKHSRQENPILFINHSV